MLVVTNELAAATRFGNRLELVADVDFRLGPVAGEDDAEARRASVARRIRGRARRKFLGGDAGWIGAALWAARELCVGAYSTRGLIDPPPT